MASMRRNAVAIVLAGTLLMGAASEVSALKIEPPPMLTERSEMYSTAPGPRAADSFREGSFEVNLVITDSREGLGKWLAMTPKQREQTARGQKFRVNQKGYLALVLTNYDVDAANVDLTARLTLIGPDGQVVYENRDLGRSAWGHPKQGYLAIRPYVDFSFDGTDKPGTYTYRVSILDNARGEVVRAEEKVILVR